MSTRTWWAIVAGVTGLIVAYCVWLVWTNAPAYQFLVRLYADKLFLKRTLPDAALCVMPRTGHLLNLEEPALFNEMVERFVTLVEAGRWPVRDPRSMAG